MAKKQQGLRKEKTIKEKEADLLRTTVASTIFMMIIIIYVGWNVQAYASMQNARDINIMDLFSGAIEEMTKNPLYFWPINYPFYKTLLISLFAPLFSLLGYTMNKLRVHHDVNTLKGSSKWADIPSLMHKFAEWEKKGNKEDYHQAYGNIILSKNVQISTNIKKHFHALNVLVIGETGGGKSRFILKPNLLQMNCNFVVTDPKGAILQECGEALRRFGYHVKVFDLIKMGDCDLYNPLKYCKKESDIKKVVQAFIKNTNLDNNGSGSKDPFWDDSMNAFLCACIGLLTQKPEGSDIPYAKIDDVIGGKDAPHYEACFGNLCEFTRMANHAYNPQTSPIQLIEGASAGNTKNNTATGSDLAVIFENLRIYESKRQDCSPDEIVKPYCLKEWENFRIAPEKTSTTILMTTAVRMDAFNIEQVKNLTNTDTIDLYNFPKEKSVLFVITPTTDSTYNFLVSFLYTQMFDILYNTGTESAGTETLKLPNGELVKYFDATQAEAGEPAEFKEALKSATYERVEVTGKQQGEREVKNKKGKKKKVKVTLDDAYYDIKLADGTWISRRPTKSEAKEYINALKNVKVQRGNGNAIPFHTRFLLDEFVNTAEVPEFDQKLSTMRSYEISCTVIIQSITQLKEKREKTYETFDGNCPEFVFLGGDENANNEYVSKKLGKQTVRGYNNSIGSKNSVTSSINVEERDLIKPEELGRLPFDEQIVILSHEDPIRDKKYDYPSHKNYKYTWDYACECGLDKVYRFDRSEYSKVATDFKAIWIPQKAVAVPNIMALTDELFKLHMYTQDNAEAKNVAVEGYKRQSFEDSSSAVVWD